MTEADRERMEQKMYFINKMDLTFSYEEYQAEHEEMEGVELDICEYEKLEREPWAKKQVRKLKG